MVRSFNFFLPFIGLVLFISMDGFGQCTPPSADECEDANLLCSLDEVNGYTCQNTTYSNPTGCSPLCPSGGGAHNTGWWAFVCDGGPVTITITFSNCSVNGSGVQMGIWGDCDCNKSIVCNPACNGPGSFTISGNLTACKTYYLFVDGCSGDVCDFTLTTTGGSAPLLPPLGKIMGPRDVCKGACNIKYTISTGGACDPTYEWTLDGTEIGSGLGEVTLNFPDEGDFQLCVTAYIGNPQSGSICDQDGPRCITILVRPTADKVGTPRTLCSERVPFNWHGELVTATGQYRHEFTDKKTCCVFDSIVYFNVIYDDSLGCKKATYISGRVFLDTNVDGIFNSKDIILKNYFLNSGPGSFTTFSSDSGYILLVTKDAVNTIKVAVPNPNFAFSVPDEYLINVGNVYGQFPGQYDFAIQEKPRIDLEVAISSTIARPGRSTIVNLRISNVGNVPVPYSKLSLKFPIGWNVIESIPKHQTVIGGNQLIWDILDTLGIKESKIFTISLETPSTAMVGSAFSLVADVYCQNDADLLNNQAIWNDRIRASIDPNDTLVDKAKYYPSADHSGELIYTIRFQNTGTDTAFDIIIRDTLSNALDPTSVRVLHASHPFQLQMKKLGNLEILFKNILLPDSSTNEFASHGFVQIAVKPKTTTDPFYITNRASIYFDFNPPVMTNTASTYVGLVNTELPVKHGKLRVTPNPFNHHMMVEYESTGNSRDYRLKIINIQGKQILNAVVEKAGQIQFNSELYPPGIYRIFYLADGKLLSSMNIMKMP
ncbi:MAG: hypothetical protein IPL25_20190 [Saprospiraceae bacterium]|nr:hypothetical protein [Candidatus Vicinibacter affinis]